MGAPVCNINVSRLSGAKKTPSVPSIPIASNDLASLAAAVNAMRQVIINLLGQQAQPPGGGPGSPVSIKPSSFRVTNQNIQTVNVYDPNDSSVFVTIRQVVGLTLENPTTGETWEWTQPGSVPGNTSPTSS